MTYIINWFVDGNFERTEDYAFKKRMQRNLLKLFTSVKLKWAYITTF